MKGTPPPEASPSLLRLAPADTPNSVSTARRRNAGAVGPPSIWDDGCPPPLAAYPRRRPAGHRVRRLLAERPLLRCLALHAVRLAWPPPLPEAPVGSYPTLSLLTCAYPHECGRAIGGPALCCACGHLPAADAPPLRGARCPVVFGRSSSRRTDGCPTVGGTRWSGRSEKEQRGPRCGPRPRPSGRANAQAFRRSDFALHLLEQLGVDDDAARCARRG